MLQHVAESVANAMAQRVCFALHQELARLLEQAAQPLHQQLQDSVIARITSSMTTEVEERMHAVQFHQKVVFN
jgi:hypothetical protein